MAEAPGDTRGPARPTHGSHASFVRPWLARHDNAPSASAQRALARPLCQLANAQIPCRTGLPFPASTRATPGSSQSRIREGLPVPRKPGSAASAARMAKRSRRAASGGHDARRERPATGRGQPRPTRRLVFMREPDQGPCRTGMPCGPSLAYDGRLAGVRAGVANLGFAPPAAVFRAVESLRAFVGLRRPPGWRQGRRGEPWLRPACLKAAGAMDGPAAVYQGITTSSEMMTGFPAVTPAGVGRATPAEGPGDPPGPIGTETPAGMPPSITAPCPSHELQPERGAADSQQAPCC